VPFLQKIADTEKDPLLREETQKAIINIGLN